MATEAREPPTTVLGMNGDKKYSYSPGLANTGKRRTGETERAMRKTMRCTKELGNKLACEKDREGKGNKGKRMGRTNCYQNSLWNSACRSLNKSVTFVI